MIGIYKIQNSINGKVYIGSSVNIESRWKSHISLLNKNLHHSYKLQRDWKTYGKDMFIFEVVEIVDDNNLLKVKEQKWMDLYHAYTLGYNILELAEHTIPKSDIQQWNEENGGFVFAIFNFAEIMFKNVDVSQQDIVKMFYLSTYLDYDNYLVYDNSFMTRKNMNDLLQISVSAFDMFFNKMKDVGIILQDTNKNMSINSMYFVKGIIKKDIMQYKDFTRVYINPMRYLYTNIPKRKHSQLGSFFRMLPFIHRDLNSLCWSPICTEENFNMISVKQLSDILSYHRNGVRNLMDDLTSFKIGNKRDIIKVVGNSAIFVNPRIFYGGNFYSKEVKDNLIELFNNELSDLDHV